LFDPDIVWLAFTSVERKGEQLMNLPLCVDPNHNPDGFGALGKLVTATRHEALAVAIVPTVADEKGAFTFVDVPAWTGNEGIGKFDSLVRQDEAQRFMAILEDHARLPISYSSNQEICELVSRPLQNECVLCYVYTMPELIIMHVD
jgi:hypothetical protein